MEKITCTEPMFTLEQLGFLVHDVLLHGMEIHGFVFQGAFVEVGQRVELLVFQIVIEANESIVFTCTSNRCSLWYDGLRVRGPLFFGCGLHRHHGITISITIEFVTMSDDDDGYVFVLDDDVMSLKTTPELMDVDAMPHASELKSHEDFIESRDPTPELHHVTTRSSRNKKHSHTHMKPRSIRYYNGASKASKQLLENVLKSPCKHQRAAAVEIQQGAFENQRGDIYLIQEKKVLVAHSDEHATFLQHLYKGCGDPKCHV